MFSLFDSEFAASREISPLAARGLPQSVEAVLRHFAPSAQEMARALFPAYGMPAEATTLHLIWLGPAPFVRTTLSANATQHNFPVPHEDVLEQCVHYPVGNVIGKLNDLAAFDGSLTVKRTEGLLCTRHATPEMNFLSLNLANDIVTGKRTWKEARLYFARAMDVLRAGQTPRYAAELTFRQIPAPDPDVSVGAGAGGT